MKIHAAGWVSALALFASLTVAAKSEIYRWVDAKGVVHYSDKPVDKDAKPADLPPIQTMRSSQLGTALASEGSVKAEEESVVVKSVRITAPASEEMIRDADGVVPVAVEVQPALPKGAGFIFLLDGKAQNNKIWGSASFSLAGVERGEHKLSVNVVDKAGKVLKSSPSVTFFMQPNVPIRR
jgi:hypothetical protein